MLIWFSTKDIPVLDFVVPPYQGESEALKGLHLRFPIGYVDSTLIFYYHQYGDQYD